MTNGHLQLNNSFFDSPLWQEERMYSPAEAFIFLLSKMCYKQASKKLINRRVVTMMKNEIAWSQQALAAKWNWSRAKVRTFFDMLRKHNRMTVRIENGITIYKIHMPGMEDISTHPEVETNPSPPASPKKQPADNPLPAPVPETAHPPSRQPSGEVTPETEQPFTPSDPPAKRQSKTSGAPQTKKGNKGSLLKKHSDECKKEPDGSFPTPMTAKFEKFKKWLQREVPQCALRKTFPQQITLEQFGELRKHYSAEQIKVILQKIGNRRDLYKRYHSLYHTAVSWLEREYPLKN